jgi:hypothetical protein
VFSKVEMVQRHLQLCICCVYVCIGVCVYVCIYIYIYKYNCCCHKLTFSFLERKISSWSTDDALLRTSKINNPLPFYKYNFEREQISVKIFSFIIILGLLVFLCWESVIMNSLMLHITCKKSLIHTVHATRRTALYF